MNNPSLIIINGLPATGKTTFAEKLSQEFDLPLLVRDKIKETLFDSLGHSDREWSRKLGSASFDLLWKMTEELMKTKMPFIVESPFNKELDSQRLIEYREKFGYEMLQIILKTPGEIRFERFVERVTTGSRHPGHVDHINFESQKENIVIESITPLEIGGNTLEIDTSDFSKIDYPKIFEEIRRIIEV
jgi:predicted kinase